MSTVGRRILYVDWLSNIMSIDSALVALERCAQHTGAWIAALVDLAGTYEHRVCVNMRYCH